MRLVYDIKPRWPALAWTTELRSGAHEVLVRCGAGVERRPSFFCEAVWDGTFLAGGFDETDLIFGSGGRLGSELVLVSSGTTVDRLVVLKNEDVIRVSNSLPALLAVSGGRALPGYGGYRREFRSITRGITEYVRQIPFDIGLVDLVYFHNLVWDGKNLSEREKPQSKRRFHGFDEYRSFLTGAMGRCFANAIDPARSQRFKPLGTLSSGYDSAAISTLSREHGVREVITFAEARNGLREDTERLASALDVDVTCISRDAWRSRPLAEIPYLAADSNGEDVYFAGAEEQLRCRLLLTGFHGDKVWDRNTPSSFATPLIRRQDASGLSLTEPRLWLGFIHIPVPFMGVRAIADINRISNSAEMKQWSVGGDYDRPICRRIVEEAGVPRHVFGQKKAAASVLFDGRDAFFQPSTRADHNRWSLDARDSWRGGILPPHLIDRLAERLVLFWYAVNSAVLGSTRPWSGDRPRRMRYLDKLQKKVNRAPPEWLRKHVMHRTVMRWALDRAIERYRT